MKAAARSDGCGTAATKKKKKKKKRKADDDHVDDAGERGCERPEGLVRRSGRKRTKVGGYAE